MHKVPSSSIFFHGVDESKDMRGERTKKEGYVWQVPGRLHDRLFAGSKNAHHARNGARNGHDTLQQQEAAEPDGVPWDPDQP